METTLPGLLWNCPPPERRFQVTRLWEVWLKQCDKHTKNTAISMAVTRQVSPGCWLCPSVQDADPITFLSGNSLGSHCVAFCLSLAQHKWGLPVGWELCWPLETEGWGADNPGRAWSQEALPLPRLYIQHPLVTSCESSTLLGSGDRTVISVGLEGTCWSTQVLGYHGALVFCLVCAGTLSTKPI